MGIGAGGRSKRMNEGEIFSAGLKGVGGVQGLVLLARIFHALDYMNNISKLYENDMVWQFKIPSCV